MTRRRGHDRSGGDRRRGTSGRGQAGSSAGDRQRVRMNRPVDPVVPPGERDREPPPRTRDVIRTASDAAPDQPRVTDDPVPPPRQELTIHHEQVDRDAARARRGTASPRPTVRPALRTGTTGTGPEMSDTGDAADETATPDTTSSPAAREVADVVAAAREDGTAPDDTEELVAPATPGAVTPFVIEPSAFVAEPWWSRGWWRLPEDGRARDVSCDAGTFGALAVVGASLRGHKHRYEGVPNDDAFTVQVGRTPEGREWVIGCVCDGVGSAARAHEGSAFIAEHVTAGLSRLCASEAWLEGEPSRDDVERIVNATRAALQAAFEIGPDELGFFESTLTFVAVEAGELPDGGRRALLGWVGDSPGLVLRSETWNHLTTNPDGDGAEDGPITTNRTAGALSHGGLEGLCALTLEHDDVLMLVSDGVGSFVTDGRQDRQLGRVLASALAGPVDVLHALNLLSFDIRTADDDRTALIIWQLTGTPDGARR